MKTLSPLKANQTLVEKLTQLSRIVFNHFETKLFDASFELF